MSIHMSARVCVYVQICVYMRAFILCLWVCTSPRAYSCAPTHANMRPCFCLYKCIYKPSIVHIIIILYKYTYTYVYVYKYIYTYTYTCRWLRIKLAYIVFFFFNFQEAQKTWYLALGKSHIKKIISNCSKYRLRIGCFFKFHVCLIIKNKQSKHVLYNILVLEYFLSCNYRLYKYRLFSVILASIVSWALGQMQVPSIL